MFMSKLIFFSFQTKQNMFYLFVTLHLDLSLLGLINFPRRQT